MYSYPVEAEQAQRRTRVKPRKRNSKPVAPKIQRVDAATFAAMLQKQEESRDFAYSLLALGMKAGILLIGLSSLFKIGLSLHQRVARYMELAKVVGIESSKLNKVQKRFDHLFTIGGKRNFIDEQEHWIAPNRIRIVWR